MDEVETVAADTTFDAHQQYSNLDHSESESLESHTQKKLRLEAPPYSFHNTSEDSLYLHRSSSDQFDRDRANRPVGIAQPIRIEDSQGTSGSGNSSSTKPLPSSDIHTIDFPKKHMQALSTLACIDEGSDSDHSQKSRYNKFSNERTAILAPNVESHSPLPKAEVGNSSSDCFEFESVTQYSKQTEEDCASQNSQSLNEKSLSYSLHNTIKLPPGKKVHVFISHHTTDEQRVKDNLVYFLRSPPHCFTVRACYAFMPDRSCYDDRAIHSYMRDSCAIIISISPAYLGSKRCRTEWENAVKFFNEGRGHRIILAAVAPCSRPDPLRGFLHLDFMDSDKIKNVRDVLLKDIDSAIQSATQALSSEGHTDSSRPGRPEEPEAREQPWGTDPTERMMKEFEADFGGMFNPDNPEDSSSDLQTIEDNPDQLVNQASSYDLYDDHVIPTISQGEGVSESEELPRKQLSQKDIEEGEVSDSSGETTEPSQTQSKLVANFYDKLAQPDADNRNESPILHMRNFNNWMKTVLIRTYLPPAATVLDLCCGKGGDMPKWKRGGIEYLVCADISESSIEQCQERYLPKNPSEKPIGHPSRDVEYHVADCCKVRLRDCYRNPARRFHLTSCQFSVHYSFESYERAHMMLRNACENLMPDGYFIGTTIDASELIHRLRTSGTMNEDGLWSIGNRVFSVTLSEGLDPRGTFPLFGAVYNFKLHGVVDLPEFLVHFPLLVSMLREFGMVLKLKQNFYDFFTERRHNSDDLMSLYRMSAFNKRSGTMSVDEWEVIGLYLVFVFQKKS